MSTPQQLIDAEAEADRLLAELNQTEGEATPPEGEKDDSAPTPEKTGDETPAPAGETAVAEEKPTKDEAATVALEGQLAELKAQLTKLQASYDTLRGKTYAEVPRVISENKTLRDRIAELEGKLAEKAEAAPKAVSAKAAEILSALKEKTDEDVAEDIQRLVNAIVDEQMSTRIAPVEGRIEGLRKTAVELAEERYLKELTERVPEWREIAATPEYSEFLSQRDELSGATLYELAKSALDRLDAGHMAKFYDRYKAAKGGAPSPSKAAPAQSANTDRLSGKEALIAPKSSVSTAAREGDSAGKPEYITTKQLEQWSRKEYRLGLTREQEAALDAKIDRAIQNRAIVPG